MSVKCIRVSLTEVAIRRVRAWLARHEGFDAGIYRNTALVARRSAVSGDWSARCNYLFRSACCVVGFVSVAGAMIGSGTDAGNHDSAGDMRETRNHKE